MGCPVFCYATPSGQVASAGSGALIQGDSLAFWWRDNERTFEEFSCKVTGHVVVISQDIRIKPQ
jgi:hypothetical protein